jgi:hypothetical protein
VVEQACRTSDLEAGAYHATDCPATPKASAGRSGNDENRREFSGRRIRQNICERSWTYDANRPPRMAVEVIRIRNTFLPPRDAVGPHSSGTGHPGSKME